MQIISHRGYWKVSKEKNSYTAFKRSFSLGFGTETDFRDYNGELVIAHDMATARSIKAADFFELYDKYPHKPTLALNVKADGLQLAFKDLIKKTQITDYFVFDMSVPDTIGYVKQGINFYSRQSEYEPQPAFYTECKGIWLDAFLSIWYTNDLIVDHLNNNKKVAIASPELHQRDHLPLWQQLKDGDLHSQKNLILCTDFPEQAVNFSKISMKIKAIIFDMDGVLIEAREWHYEALNSALSLFGAEISRYDHLVTFDGLPTKKKLEMLSLEGGFPYKLHDFVNDLKQQYTMETVYTKCKPVFQHRFALSKLKTEGYKLAVASNSTRKSVEIMMEKSGLMQYIEFFISNQDVENSKPHPEMYITAIERLGLHPTECLIVEDNDHGIKAATASGAHVLKVESPDDVHYYAIKKRVEELENA